MAIDDQDVAAVPAAEEAKAQISEAVQELSPDEKAAGAEVLGKLKESANGFLIQFTLQELIDLLQPGEGDEEGDLETQS
ncbi:hypothetical protein ACFXHA_38415 [Nocardia sp. NPDC059240]|uniref:hypothetical protein n=1 Tax=Nocardia sp. NPDC059240 TaxID=3346786 RepID=UPI00368A2B5C